MKSIYYRTPYQQTLVYDIKAPFNQAMTVLTNPGSSPVAKIRAVNQLRKLVPVILSLPEPTRENTRQPNTHILIDIRDQFFRRLVLPTRWKFLRAMVNFVIFIYDTDFYRGFIDWWVEELRKSDWKPPGPMQPDPHHFKSEQEVT